MVTPGSDRSKWLPGAAVLVWSSCGSPAPEPAAIAVAVADRPTATSNELPVPEAASVEAIRIAGATFREWGRFDGNPRLGNPGCNPPPPHRIRMSSAERPPHGRKLYWLWTNEPGAYDALRADRVAPGRPGPTVAATQAFQVARGFTIVKEAFEARRATRPEDPPPQRAGRLARRPSDPGVPGVPGVIDTIEVDGAWVTVGPPSSLFVMTKLADHDVPGTDGGWIYGTVDVGGVVTSHGRVATCMACHATAPHDRLFGPT